MRLPAWPVAAAIGFVIAAADAAVAAPTDPDPADAAAIRECLSGKANVKAQEACVPLIVNRCFKEVGNEWDITIRDCNRRGQEAWDRILNEAYQHLRETLEARRFAALRDLQRAWIKAKDKRCNRFWEEFKGTMAHPMIATCDHRETARRALFLLNYGSAKGADRR
ncbi:MAG: lysozyme inhibitor LprI family protein [Xanthobacteraceae bacterium]